MARPTRKAVYLALGAGVLFLMGTNIQAGWLYVLGASLLGAAVAGLSLPRLALRGLRFERRAPNTMLAGESADVGLISHRDPRSGGLVAVEDRFCGTETSLVLRDGTSVLDHIAEPRRGVYDGGEVTATSGFPFGTGRASRAFRLEGRYVVHPTWEILSGFPLLEAASFPNESLHDRRRKGAGLDFYGIREYRPGDSMRSVHWRSMARRGVPLVKQYEEELASRAGVFIDDRADHVPGDQQDPFEVAISAAASICLYALDAGHPVSVACAGAPSGEHHLLEPGRIEALDWMASLRGRSVSTIAEVVARSADYVKPRSTNVLIIPAVDDALAGAKAAAESLRSLGTRVIVVMVSSRLFGISAAAGEEAEATFTQELTAAHSNVFILTPERSLEDCLSSALV